MKNFYIILGCSFSLLGCLRMSDPVDLGNNTYMIYGNASPMAGGFEKVISTGYNKANAFCSNKIQNAHAVIINQRYAGTYHSTTDAAWKQGSGNLHQEKIAGDDKHKIVFQCVK